MHDPTLPTVGPLRRHLLQEADVSVRGTFQSILGTQAETNRRFRIISAGGFGKYVALHYPMPLCPQPWLSGAWPSISVSSRNCQYVPGIHKANQGYRRRSLHGPTRTGPFDPGSYPNRYTPRLANPCTPATASGDVGHALTLLLCVGTKQVGEREKGRENVSHVSNLGRVHSGGTGATGDRPSLTRNQKPHTEYGVASRLILTPSSYAFCEFSNSEDSKHPGLAD